MRYQPVLVTVLMVLVRYEVVLGAVSVGMSGGIDGISTGMSRYYPGMKVVLGGMRCGISWYERRQ